MELAILYILSTADKYRNYVRFIPRHLVAKETYTIISDLKEWYKSNTSVEWTDFASWFKLVRHASMEADTLELYSAIFTKMDGYTPTGTDLETVHALVSRDYAVKIADLAGDVADGAGGKLDDIDPILLEWRTATDKTKDIEAMFVTNDIDAIMNTVVPDGGMKWRLPEMNLALGPIRRGDFIIIGARPGTGKTTLLASEATFLAEQMIKDDKYVLWFCNEEIGERVKYKVIQSCLGITHTDLISDKHMHHSNYLSQLNGERVKLVYEPTLTMQLVESVVAHYKDKVGLIIFDQLYNFQTPGGANTNEVAKQGALFAWARGMSHYAPVITAHQVKGTGQGVMYLEMDQLYGSTTLVQGACDAIVMLGKPDGPEFKPGTRGLYVPRNKLIGDLKSDGKFRNGKFEVELKHEIVRYKGAY
jgi:replicative DNA helicase